jgi:hypothetical protein
MIYPLVQQVVEASESGRHRVMGQARPCADNALTESFFSLRQKNILDKRRVWPTGINDDWPSSAGSKPSTIADAESANSALSSARQFTSPTTNSRHN